MRNRFETTTQENTRTNFSRNFSTAIVTALIWINWQNAIASDNTYVVDEWEWIYSAMQEFDMDYQNPEERQRLMEYNNMHKDWVYYYEWRKLEPGDVIVKPPKQATQENIQVEASEDQTSENQTSENSKEQEYDNIVLRENIELETWENTIYRTEDGREILARIEDIKLKIWEDTIYETPDDKEVTAEVVLVTEDWKIKIKYNFQ